MMCGKAFVSVVVPTFSHGGESGPARFTYSSSASSRSHFAPKYLSAGRVLLKFVTHAGSWLKYQVEETMLPVVQLNQYAAFAWRPAGRMAERSLTEIPMTFERSLVTRRSSSPTVELSNRFGLTPGSFGSPPRIFTESSVTLVMRLPVGRSSHSLAMIPDSDGYAPVIIVAWPGAV